jgi:peptide/nickel transport system substrate-binding protein
MVPFRNAIAPMALAVILVTAATSCSGTPGSQNGSPGAPFQGGFGSLPPDAGTPKSGGVVSFAEAGPPNWIFPIVPSAENTVFNVPEFIQLMWRPLYWSPVGASPQVNYRLSLARKPVFSDGGRAVTISLDRNYRWSDGQPVDANDVIFFIDLLKAAVKESPANSGNYAPGYFPDNVVSAVAADPYTVKLRLSKAYNPNWFFLDQLSLISPLPHTAWSKVNGTSVDYTAPSGATKIYDALKRASSSLHTYASNPLWQVVDGPFHLTSFTASNGAATLKPNTEYTGAYRPHLAAFKLVPFTSTTAEFNQLRSGALTVGGVDFTDLPQVPALERNGYRVFGYPSFGFNYMVFNFSDHSGHWDDIVSQLYVRQALAHLINQPGYIRAYFDNAAAQDYGPVPAIPVSPYAPANATRNPFPYSVAAARSILSAHGWKVVPGGTTTCARPGDATGECGAGIPAGTALSFNLIYSSGTSVNGLMAAAFASAAKQAGITVNTTAKAFSFILENYNDQAAPSNANQWGSAIFGGFGGSGYPTTNTLFNTGGSYNFGNYSDPAANALIHNSVFGGNLSAVRAEASYLTTHLPGLFLPNVDNVYAWKTDLRGPAASFATMTQGPINPEMWFCAHPSSHDC